MGDTFWQVVFPGRSDLVGKVGRCVARYCDPSYDDIRLEFADGSRCWLRFHCVRQVTAPSQADQNRQEEPAHATAA